MLFSWENIIILLFQYMFPACAPLCYCKAALDKKLWQNDVAVEKQQGTVPPKIVVTSSVRSEPKIFSALTFFLFHYHQLGFLSAISKSKTVCHHKPDHSAKLRGHFLGKKLKLSKHSKRPKSEQQFSLKVPINVQCYCGFLFL